MPQDPKPERNLPQRSGRSGAVGLPISIDQLPALMAQGDPEATDRALMASWKQQLGSSPEKLEQADYSGEHGFDVRLLGFKEPEAYDRQLHELIIAACARSDPAVVTVELARLRLGTVGRNLEGLNMDAWLTVVGDELEQYPPDIIRCACRKWLRREKWTPAVAEMVEECERLFRSRRLLEMALRRLWPQGARQG